MAAGNGPIRRLCVVDVRESMANGGGPACLRLRVVADPATVDPRFLVDEAKLDRIAGADRSPWPERIAPDDLADPGLHGRIAAPRASALLSTLDLAELGLARRPFSPAKEKRHARQVSRPAEGRRRRPVRQARRHAEGQAQGRVEAMAESMSEKQLEEFASTKRKGKPEHAAD